MIDLNDVDPTPAAAQPERLPATRAEARARLIGTAGIADVNFRVKADALGNLYLLGRARSGEELKKAIRKLEEGDGVRKVYNYAAVRP